MLRTEQILNAKFTPVSKGTYSAEEVDSFIKAVAESYDESLNQNKELIKKISILADKIESYRNDEEAIKLALLDAHKMAETINKNANIKAENILTDAETRSKIILDGANRQANQSIEDAKFKAKEIVDNARIAVSSLTERAQVETESTIKSAQSKAAEIVAVAEEEAKAIIGSSKESYEFYSAELARVKAETAKFKEAIQELCKGQLSLLDGIPEFIAAVNAVSVVAEQVSVEEEVVEEQIAEEIPELVITEDTIESEEEIIEIIEENDFAEEIAEEIFVPVIEEEPVTFAPEVYAEEEVADEILEIAVEEDEDDDDLFSFINDMNFDDISDSISSDIDNLLPEMVEEDYDVDIEVEDEEDEEIDVIEEDEIDDDDEFEGFKVDLDAIEDINSASDDYDDDDIASLFDSMFED